MDNDDVRRIEIPKPDADMTPEEKGDLLLRYIRTGRVVSGLLFHDADLRGADLRGAYLAHVDLREALLHGAVLDKATLDGADLGAAYLNGASLRGASLTGARLWGVRFRDADLRGADLTNAVLEEAILFNAKLDDVKWWGARVDHLTYDRSGWTPSVVRSLHDANVRFNDLDRFPAAARLAITRDLGGLTLTFDTRLHRFDGTAFDLLIAQVLGHDTDVTIEGRSNVDEHPGWIRINGSRIEDLVSVAEAFYNRTWEDERPQPSEAAVMQAMTSGFAAILGCLSQQRDHLVRIDESVGILANPDVQEMLEGQGAAFVLETDRRLLQTRFQRVAEAAYDEARHRLGEKAVDVVVGGAVELLLGGPKDD
ncbi:MAG: pentapeptide repeat-containing protein [Pseudomonadota bacterium]